MVLSGLREIVLEIALQLKHILLNEISRPKRIWTRKWIQRRNSLGASLGLFSELAEEDKPEYFNALRMTEDTFNIILSLVELKIKKDDTFMHDALSAKLKLHIVLYFLAQGCSFPVLSHFFRVSKSAISLMIPDVCDAIYEALEDFMKVPKGEEWNKIANGFFFKWNFPECCGALDGKHVTIKAPGHAGSYYYNYKHSNSIVLMALVDDNYCFSYIDVDCNGRISDGGVFKNCKLGFALEKNLLPDNCVIVADNAFPLKSYMMKPYPGLVLIIKEKIFNYHLSRARRIVENAFGILVARFRIFEKPIPVQPYTVDKIVKACCALHNWLRKTCK